MMFIMVFLGFIFYRKGIISQEAKRCLTDLTLFVFIPCNMLSAFFHADHSQIGELAEIMLVSFLIQVFQYLLGLVLYRKKEPGVRSVMRYSTMVSNAGFLGNPMAESMYGQEGLLLAAVFLVPVRLFYWTLGLACFAPVDKKNVVKTVCTHPCIIAVVLGLLYLFFPIPLPTFLTDTVTTFSSAMTPVTMLLIGAILGDVNLRTIVSKDTIEISAIRLLIIPAIVLLAVKLADVEPLIASVTVVLVSMPVATTTAILASRYEGDAAFATKAIVLSTVLSMVTIPMWGIIVEQII